MYPNCVFAYIVIPKTYVPMLGKYKNSCTLSCKDCVQDWYACIKTFCVISFAFVFLIRFVSMEVNTFVLKILLCIKIKIEFTEVWEQYIFVLFFITGIIGSAVLKYITPKEKRGMLGATVPAPGVTAGQAVGIEILLTFLLVFTVCASTDPKRNHYGYEVPLSIGLCVAVCHFIGVGGRMVSSYRLI